MQLTTEDHGDERAKEAEKEMAFGTIITMPPPGAPLTLDDGDDSETV
jgi:hypothetical protein